MSFTFRPAKREGVGLLIGLAGSSGSGKTYTAMRLASGIAGDKSFAVIDTEAGRALHYADTFRFDHGALHAPFRPASYVEAIKTADAAGYPVIVVDSVSHEHAGEGGLLEFHDEELTRMAGDDYRKREACKMAAWIRPKMEHKKMISALLQVKAHLILCFRAEEKIEMKRDENGRMAIIKKQTATGLDGWVPISEKNLPYELTASFLMLASNPGVPLPIKLQEQHRPIFPDGVKIDESCGKRLAEWAGGAGKSNEKTKMAKTASNTEKPDKFAALSRQTIDLQAAAHEAAMQGMEAFKAFWLGCNAKQQRALKELKDELKAVAADVDNGMGTKPSE